MKQTIYKLKYDILAVLLVIVIIAIIVMLNNSNKTDSNNTITPETNNVNIPNNKPTENTPNTITPANNNNNAQNNTSTNTETKPVEETTSPITANCDNLAAKANFFCDTTIKGYNCSSLNDNNISSLWFSNYVCASGNNPCSILTYLKISSQEQFNTIQLYNRPEDSFFINRVLITYNNHTDKQFVGGHTFTSKPWPIYLNESTNQVKIKIVEVFGAGKNFPTGVAEIKLFADQTCIN